MSRYELDLRGVACPMNFVKTKLFLDKIEVGSLVEVLLDPGEPVESVVSSIGAEGHVIEQSQEQPSGYYLVGIRKCATAELRNLC